MTIGQGRPGKERGEHGERHLLAGRSTQLGGERRADARVGRVEVHAGAREAVEARRRSAHPLGAHLAAAAREGRR